MRKHTSIILILFALLIASFTTVKWCQSNGFADLMGSQVGEQRKASDYRIAIDSSYSFIRYSRNNLYIGHDSALMNQFFNRWSQVLSTGLGQLNIMHIGSSHVQAGTLPNAIRRNIMLTYPSAVAGRGMIFPYSAAAKCNNPFDYAVHCPQKVELTRNVYKEPAWRLGLCGIAVTARDTHTTIDIILNEKDIPYATTHITILGYSPEGVVPYVLTATDSLQPYDFDTASERYVYNLSRAVDSFRIVLPCDSGSSFALTGVMLNNDCQGLSYHSIGVNGASLNDYLRCPDFTRDLHLVHPDAVVFGIGINDASGKNFDTAVFRRSYLQLIDSIRSVCPSCAFIFITNNDSYRRQGRKGYVVNINGALAREVFYRLADEVGGAVWDQFEVMGGLRSMNKWYEAKLAQRDRVHFTRAGYTLIGNLFSDALLRAYQQSAGKAAPVHTSENNTSTIPSQNSNDERPYYLSY